MKYGYVKAANPSVLGVRVEEREGRRIQEEGGVTDSGGSRVGGKEGFNICFH